MRRIAAWFSKVAAGSKSPTGRALIAAGGASDPESDWLPVQPAASPRSAP